jgi:hypothetical protein
MRVSWRARIERCEIAGIRDAGKRRMGYGSGKRAGARLGLLEDGYMHGSLLDVLSLALLAGGSLLGLALGMRRRHSVRMRLIPRSRA